MKLIQINYNSEIEISNSAEKISQLLDQAEKHFIKETSWRNKNYIGNCEFAVLYGKDAIAIKYYVTEDEIKAVYNQPNDPVYLDSCVEFFVSLDQDSYYNFEFNCNGTCLSQVGKNKQNRSFLPLFVIDSIKTTKSIKYIDIKDVHLINWELTVVIPFSAFINHQLDHLDGKELRMNFYKCGDELPQPHYLCWNKVETIEPNFHVPEFFGIGKFI
ncbi:carbohydrate-binding family 9-like protein [Pseudopedobacter beijingensis]|uniref:Carbohydrate-binding family 9-like protein n=1 Tax=Pseudopedobacter beijingensis TaxID=1207056 RepID=A0ABW4IGD5_9SPHI